MLSAALRYGALPRRDFSMSARVVILSDVHGNLAALTAVRAAIKKERPDAVVIAGDHVMNGPDPSGVVDALRDMEASGATIVQGNTDVAVADFDYSAAFPWMVDGEVACEATLSFVIPAEGVLR